MIQTGPMKSPAGEDTLVDQVGDLVRFTLTDDRYAPRRAVRFLQHIPADCDAATMHAIDEVLADADPRFWLALENARRSLWQPLPDAERTAPAARERPDAPDNVPVPVPTWLVRAVFADGRVRQQAVEALAASGSRAALPVLALRSADWVQQVRKPARDAVRAALDDDADGSRLADVAPVALLIAARLQARWLAEDVLARLSGSHGGPALERLVHGSDRRTRRIAFDVLRDTGRLDLERALEPALRDRDIVVRTRCAAHAARLARTAGTTDALSAMRLMFASRTPLVRAEALSALFHLGASDEVTAALTDRSFLVRGAARFHLRPRGIDFPSMYRSLLHTADATTAPAVIAAFAEVVDTAHGAADDVLAPLLDHPEARVRASALKALRSGPVGIDADLLLGLVERDPSPAVRRVVIKVLLDRHPGLDSARLLDLLNPARPAPVRLAARTLLAGLGDAWRVAVDVSLLADADATVATTAKADLLLLLRRSLNGRPDGGVPGGLMARHLADADRLLAPHEARLLRFSCGLPRA